MGIGIATWPHTANDVIPWRVNMILGGLMHSVGYASRVWCLNPVRQQCIAATVGCVGTYTQASCMIIASIHGVDDRMQPHDGTCTW